MKKFWQEIFQESSGSYSMVRVLSFLCVVVALVIAMITAVKVYYSQPIILGETVVPHDISYVAALSFLVMGLLGFGLGAKVTQKWGERDASIEPGNQDKLPPGV